ncbi:AEL_collapsed_G0046310.mRNA.1.CDS.1 [Saccharomyces cerevisiae]|nr:AEL_collapsed_G0046310.mRNA.1.CDS.1 [Saccharomyces cerevisiae]
MNTANTLDGKFVSEGSWRPDLFKGKVAFVTGGAGTICRVQTEALVLLGCKAAIVGRDQERTEQAAKGISQLAKDKDAVLAIANVDVRNFEQVENAVKKTVEKFGKIDFVIAGAAGNFVCDFANLSPNAFKSVVDIDLLGIKRFHPFVSATFHYYGVPFQGHVGAAKAGIDALAKNLAVELGPLGIRSNCIAPGAIDNTEGLKRLAGKKYKEKALAKIPLQRLGSTRDIAESTVYIFSPAASYVTGTVLVVDGGMWHLGTYFGHELYPEALIKSMTSKL